MRKIKFSAVFAAIGFFLTFIAGFFSHSSIIFIFLKALLWALIFGILGFGINLVYERFLNESSDQDFTTDTPSSVSQPQKGQLVDITIQDEELKDSDSGNHFVVGGNHQMLNSIDVKSSPNQQSEIVEEPVAKVVPQASPAQTAPAENKKAAPAPEAKVSGNNLEVAASASGFVPVRNLETITNVSGTEASKASEFNASEQSSEVKNVDDELDVLPDMEGLSFAENEEEPVDADTDSEFVSVHKKSGDENPADIKDAELMAKAISDVLSRDDS